MTWAPSWRPAGDNGTEITVRPGAHVTTVARALAGVPRPGSANTQSDTEGDVEQELLPVPTGAATENAASHDDADDDALGICDAEPSADREQSPALTGSAGSFIGSARIQPVTYGCRYTGAMPHHPYLPRLGAEAIFSTLIGGPARRYDDLTVLSHATVGFALGIITVKDAEYLRRSGVGPEVGVRMSPELATFRDRVGVLADGADPLALQRAFAAGMLAIDPAADPVYFVDDHFVACSGSRRVTKGWNTKRRHAQSRIDDTMLVDACGRAVVFGTGEPSGLASTLPGALTQLRQVIGPDTAVLLGFDRGGAFSVAFNACHDAYVDTVTVVAAHVELAAAERALAHLLAGPAPPNRRARPYPECKNVSAPPVAQSPKRRRRSRRSQLKYWSPSWTERETCS